MAQSYGSASSGSASAKAEDKDEKHDDAHADAKTSAAPATPAEPKKRDQWSDIKDWVRREIDLAVQGHSIESRETENP